MLHGRPISGTLSGRSDDVQNIYRRWDAVLEHLDFAPGVICYLDVRSLASFAKLNKLCAHFAKGGLASIRWYIYVIGSGPEAGFINKAERYSVDADNWEALPSLPNACCVLSACA